MQGMPSSISTISGDTILFDQQVPRKPRLEGGSRDTIGMKFLSLAGRSPLRAHEDLESGTVHMNDQTVHDEPRVPFGGVKDSGWGRFGGKAALEEFTELGSACSVPRSTTPSDFSMEDSRIPRPEPP